MTLLPKRKRLRDRQYLASYNGAQCFTCGIQDGTIVGAHIRTGSYCGVASKPDDDLTMPSCSKCHAEQHRIGEEEFWKKHGHTIAQIKEIARERYRKWNAS